MDFGINSAIKKYKTLSFLFVGFVVATFLKRGLISGYFLFAPVH